MSKSRIKVLYCLLLVKLLISNAMEMKIAHEIGERQIDENEQQQQIHWLSTSNIDWVGEHPISIFRIRSFYFVSVMFFTFIFFFTLLYAPFVLCLIFFFYAKALCISSSPDDVSFHRNVAIATSHSKYYNCMLMWGIRLTANKTKIKVFVFVNHKQKTIEKLNHIYQQVF